MTERLPSPADLLRARASGPASVTSDANGVVHTLLDLADRGDYLEAATRAVELIQGPSSDVRLIAVYLAGLFVERGAPVLPAVLDAVAQLSDERSRRVDSALEWLLRAIVDRVAYHTTRRDETWESWLRELSAAQALDIATRCDALLNRLETGAVAVQKLARWAREKLMPAVARARKAAAPAVPEPAASDPEPDTAPDWSAPDPGPTDDPEETTDEPDDDALVDDERDDDEPGPDMRRFVSHGPHAHAVMLDSPALAELRDKLRAFEIVLVRGELDKAAVIAHDLQAILGSFDPLVYLPALFGRYAELLHGAFPEIEARWDDAGSPRWRILVQFYRTNLAAFVGE